MDNTLFAVGLEISESLRGLTYCSINSSKSLCYIADCAFGVCTVLMILYLKSFEKQVQASILYYPLTVFIIVQKCFQYAVLRNANLYQTDHIISDLQNCNFDVPGLNFRTIFHLSWQRMPFLFSQQPSTNSYIFYCTFLDIQNYVLIQV